MYYQYEPPSPEVLTWVGEQVHPRGRVVRSQRLLGGITAAMDLLVVESPAGQVQVVLRRWPQQEWTQALVAREASGLEAVRGSGVPAPELLGLDEDGATAGVRCTLTSALPGRPNLAPADPDGWLGQLASTHAAIHAIPRLPSLRWDGWDFDGAPVTEQPLEWLADTGLREAAREVALRRPVVDEVVFVHGDYQHFNVLWMEDSLSGIIDWPNAAAGNRGRDVGHCRLNLAVLFDAQVAADYLVRYEEAAGVRVDPAADVTSLLCFSPAWQKFIPTQVDGRAPLDVAGMPDRVADTVRAVVEAAS